MNCGEYADSVTMIRTLDARTLGADAVVAALARSPKAVAPEIHRAVDEILAAVRARGDAALIDWIEQHADELRPRGAAGQADGLSPAGVERLTELIARNVTIKAAVVVADEQDVERRAAPRARPERVNLGNQFAADGCGGGHASRSM